MGRSLRERLGVTHIEVDAHHAGGQDGFDGRRIERDEWITAYRAAYREVEQALAIGRSVVFDAVSYRRSQRDRIRRISDKYRIPLTVTYLDVDREESRARIAANRRNPVRVSIPDEDLDEIAAGMQPPQPDEDVVTYRPNEPLEDWIDRTIRPMLKETDE
jgi:predicted kinase